MTYPAALTVVGAGLASAHLVKHARRLGYTGPVTMIGDEPYTPYDRPPLSKAVLTDPGAPEPRALLSDEDLDRLEVEFIRATAARALDPEAKTILLDDGTASGYEVVAIATGARARTAAGLTDVPGVASLRSWDDCRQLRRRLAASHRVAVVGAGVLGLEIAASATGLGKEVTVLETAARPLARLCDTTVAGAVAEVHREHGVDLRLGCAVRAIRPQGSGYAIDLAEETIDVDLVVAAIGSTPNTDWLASSGLALDDGILCDAFGRTSVPDVWAAGDVARFADDAGVRAPRTEHWTDAQDTAGLVAQNLLAEPGERRPLQATPYVWSDQFDLKIQSLGSAAGADDFRVVAGALDETRMLGVYSRAGRVHGVIAFNMAGPVNKCRRFVAAHAPLEELLAAEPWVRRPATRPST